MTYYFADTLYWVASIMPTDSWHLSILRINSTLNNSIRIVTTDEVLTEVLSTFSGTGAHLRSQATVLVRALLSADHIEVLPQSRESFLSGLNLYEARRDKGYSLVDCISMQTMRRMGIRDVLTNDHHFVQEGFVALIEKTS